jgi:hypothetical protein
MIANAAYRRLNDRLPAGGARARLHLELAGLRDA